MDDFDDLLAGLDALGHFLAEGLVFDSFDEVSDYFEIHVRVQQRQPDLAQGITHVGFGDFAQPAQVAKRVLEFAAQGLEHAVTVELEA